MSEGDARGGHGASLRDYLRVVRRRKWIILQAVLLVPAVAVATVCGILAKPPITSDNSNRYS